MTQHVPPADALHARLVFGTAEDVRAVADEHGSDPFVTPCAALNGGHFATNLMMMGTDHNLKLEMIRAAVNHPRVGTRIVTAPDANGNTFAHAVAMVPNASRELVISCLEYAESVAGVDALSVRRPEDGKTIIHIAARTPSIHTLSFIQQHPRLGKPAFVRATMADGVTAVHLAAMGDLPAALAKLAEMGGAAWARTVADVQGCGVAHFAASFGAEKVLEFLVRDPNFGPAVLRAPLPAECDRDPETGRAAACHMAAYNGRIECADTLLRLMGPEYMHTMTPDTRANMAHFAATGDQPEIITWLLRHPQLRELPTQSNHFGIFPFHLAAKAGSVNTLRVCVEELGADVVRMRTPGQLGMNVAHFAACNGATESLEYISATKGLGRDVLVAKDGQGMTIAASAALNGRVPTLQWIVRTLGVPFVKSLDMEGRTAAHAAALGNVSVLQFFAGHPEFGEAFLRQRDGSGNTIAHMAAMEGHTKVLSYIESTLGADFVRSPNNARVTPQRTGAAYPAVQAFFARGHAASAATVDPIQFFQALLRASGADSTVTVLDGSAHYGKRDAPGHQGDGCGTCGRARPQPAPSQPPTASGAPSRGGGVPCGAGIDAPALHVKPLTGSPSRWVDELD